MYSFMRFSSTFGGDFSAYYEAGSRIEDMLWVPVWAIDLSLYKYMFNKKLCLSLDCTLPKRTPRPDLWHKRRASHAQRSQDHLHLPDGNRIFWLIQQNQGRGRRRRHPAISSIPKQQISAMSHLCHPLVATSEQNPKKTCIGIYVGVANY